MIISIWNIRGFNKPIKHSAVLNFHRENKVDILGVLETRVKSNKARKVLRTSFNRYSAYCNYNKHNNGRIWLLWNPMTTKVDILEEHAQVVQCNVKHLVTGMSYYFSVVYGSNNDGIRKALWSSMTQDCGPDDLTGSGCDFTWFNKHEAATRVYSKLDSILVNSNWAQQFTQTTAHFLSPGISDHSPAMLSFHDNDMPKRSFKFLNAWLDHPDFSKIVVENWKGNIQGNPMFRLMSKLRNVKHGLRKLHTDHFANINQRVRDKREELAQCFQCLKSSATSAVLIEQEQTLSK
ncbi:uncharacterized protein LOC141619991 [Silene latifolia]|uniref:uncharacterized protein LOC141619991 n=1 Tax=Silene latifolia TaxID=37657 RepID=UPI003D77A441